MSKRIGVFAGSFCPPTIGHYKAIEKASLLVDKLYVVIGVNTSKKHAISLADRMSLLVSACNQLDNVEIAFFDGLMTDCCVQLGATVMFKSVRNATELQDVIDLADFNANNWKGQTVFLVADKQYRHISSTMIRELVALGKDITQYVPCGLADKIVQLLGENK